MRRPIKRQALLKEELIKDFSGGLSVVDNDLSLSSKYQKVCTNFYRALDGALSLRYGTEVTKDLTSTLGSTTIVNAVYHQGNHVVFGSDGLIYKVTDAGVVTTIWNDTIANAINAGAPGGWNTHQFVSFAVFNQFLVCCNGIDKPIRINFNEANPVDYIKDPVSGVNTNTPICRYVTVVDRFVCMAGDPLHIDRVYISNADTYNTWPGDGAPNNAIIFDIGKRVNTSNPLIKGITEFKTHLVVSFDLITVLFQLGTFNASNVHVPEIVETIAHHGSISHRTLVPTGNDLYSCDFIGITSIARAIVTGQFKPARVSELVDPDINTDLSGLTIGAQEDFVYAINHEAAGQLMLFIPNASTVAGTTATKVYVFTKYTSDKAGSWSVFTGWNFKTAYIHTNGILYFATTKKLLRYGSILNEIYTDSGTNISFDAELPWIDLGSRMRYKHTRHLTFDSRGQGHFTAQVFVDNVYKQNGDYDPYASLDFVGGDTGGYGNLDQPYGGGRPTQDPRLYGFRTKFKTIKFRIVGATDSALKIISIYFTYLIGGLR